MKAKTKTGFLFTYKARITDKEANFANLQQIKLVDTISVFSKFMCPDKVTKYLRVRVVWPESNEARYFKFELESVTAINENLTDIRKKIFWEIANRPDHYTTTDNQRVSLYTCFTTESYLKFLYQKYKVKAWVFTDKVSKPYFLLKDHRKYLSRIKYGSVVILDQRVADKCLRIKNAAGHKTEFIYDDNLVPKFETNKKHKRKPLWSSIEPKHSFEHDPVKQRLVCITDGITVWRRKQYQAEKVINRFPKTFKFCTKAVYQEFIDKLRKREPKLTTPNSKGIRKDRRYQPKSRTAYIRDKYTQFIPSGEKWVTDSNDEDYEELVQFPARTLHHRLKKKPTALKPHLVSRYRKDRLMKKYREVFKGVERRDGKFSKIEKWSKEFMTILNMVKTNKSEKEIALRISENYPGWNDKMIKRFINYLKLTSKGLNYIPNKKTKKPSLFSRVTKDAKGIQINKLPYYQDFAVKYTKKDNEGKETTVIERGVKVKGKKIVKYDEELKEDVILCPVKDVQAFVTTDKFTEGEDCPWTPLITIVPIKRTVVVKNNYHLPVKKIKSKKWHNPMNQDINVYGRHCDMIRRKIKNNKSSQIEAYLTPLLRSLSPKNLEGFTKWVRDSEPTLHRIIEDKMGLYIEEKYINTPMRYFVINMAFPF